jgi:hypothetical protein
MTRGIHLKQLTHTDLAHLGLAPDTLQGALDMAERDGDGADTDTRVIAQEVLATLEDVFELLCEALPADRA